MREFTALGVQRCPAQASPWTKESFWKKQPLRTISREAPAICSGSFSFHPFIEHTICWVPFSARWSHQHILAPPGNSSQYFLLGTPTLKDPLAILQPPGNYHRVFRYLEDPMGVSIFTRHFSWAPFILFFFGTSVWTILKGYKCAAFVFSLCKVKGKGFSLQEREQRFF